MSRYFWSVMLLLLPSSRPQRQPHSDTLLIMVSVKSLQNRLTRHTVPKILLRLTGLATALIGVGTAASGFRYSPNLIWLTIPPAVSALWAVISLALLLSPLRPHPAISMIVDFALVPILAAAAALACIAAAVFAGGLAADRALHACVFAFIGTDDRDEGQCESLLVQIGALAMGSGVCAALTAVMHFVFFVGACRELHAWRQKRAEERARKMAMEMVRRGQRA